MPLDGATGADLDGRIAEWRAWLTRRGAAAPDVNALEERLRSHAEDLALAGLSADEAFLIAATRLASEDALTRDWARGQQNSLVSRLLVAGDDSIRTTRRAMVVGVAIATVGAFFAVAAVVANIYPFPGATETSATEILLVVHLPVLLWFVVGLAHAGTRWRQSDARMDAVRFTGEWAIYFALIALGGGVLVGLSVAVFSAIRLEVEDVVVEWVLPFGAAGAVIVAALLVEAKRSVVENIAPVLTKLFTPLFALLLLAFLGAMAWTRTVDIDREVLIIFDLLLVVRPRSGPVLHVSQRPWGPAWGLRQAAVGARRQRPRRRRCRAERHGEPHRVVGAEPEQAGGLGLQHCPVHQPRVARLDVARLPSSTAYACLARAVADGLPADLRRVGGHRRGGRAAGLRLRLGVAESRFSCHPSGTV